MAITSRILSLQQSARNCFKMVSYPQRLIIAYSATMAKYLVKQRITDAPM